MYFLLVTLSESSGIIEGDSPCTAIPVVLGRGAGPDPSPLNLDLSPPNPLIFPARFSKGGRMER
jgi:hypothetical protein